MNPTRSSCEFCAALSNAVFANIPDPREAVEALYALVRAHHGLIPDGSIR